MQLKRANEPSCWLEDSNQLMKRYDLIYYVTGYEKVLMITLGLIYSTSPTLTKYERIYFDWLTRANWCILCIPSSSCHPSTVGLFWLHSNHRCNTDIFSRSLIVRVSFSQWISAALSGPRQRYCTIKAEYHHLAVEYPTSCRNNYHTNCSASRLDLKKIGRRYITPVKP